MNKNTYQLKLYWKRLLRYIDLARYIFFGKYKPSYIENAIPVKDGTVIEYLNKLNQFMKDNFYYKYDVIDFAKHPYSFYEDKNGDCDDFSLMALFCLRKQGIESNLMIVFKEGEGHAVCVVKDEQGNYHHISNWGLVSAFNSLDAVASNVFPDLTSWWLMSYNLSIIEYKQVGGVK